MAVIKMTKNNYDSTVNDMKNNTGASRTDTYYFSKDEINLKDLRDLAWKKNVVVTISSIDDYVSSMNFSLLLT
jgi:hypothetical protein